MSNRDLEELKRMKQSPEGEKAEEAKTFKDNSFKDAVNNFTGSEAKDAKAFIVKHTKEIEDRLTVIEDDYIEFDKNKKEIDSRMNLFEKNLDTLKKSSEEKDEEKDPEIEKKYITSLEKRIIILEESSKVSDEKIKVLEDSIKTIMASPAFDKLKEPSQFDKIYPEPGPAAKSEKVQIFWVSYVANSPYFGKDERTAINKANSEEPGVEHIANEEYWWINSDGARMRRATGEELDKLEELGEL